MGVGVQEAGAARTARVRQLPHSTARSLADPPARLLLPRRWGLLFPLGTFAQSTVRLSEASMLDWIVFKVLGAALDAATVLAWAVCCAATLIYSWRRQLQARARLDGRGACRALRSTGGLGGEGTAAPLPLPHPITGQRRSACPPQHAGPRPGADQGRGRCRGSKGGCSCKAGGRSRRWRQRWRQRQRRER